MKWVTHQTGAILGAIALNAPPAALVMAIPGAILPDMLDLKMAGLGRGKAGKQKVFNKVHRGSSHWFGWWLGLLLLVLSIPLPPLLQDALAGLALGGFCHVLMDMLTPRGIPVFPFSRLQNVSTPICSTGTRGEYIFLACLILAGIFMLCRRLGAIFPESVGALL